MDRAEPKFCKDCKHARPFRRWWNYFSLSSQLELGGCAAQVAAPEYNLLTGEMKPPRLEDCYWQRRPLGACQPEGLLWEPKP